MGYATGQCQCILQRLFPKASATEPRGVANAYSQPRRTHAATSPPATTSHARPTNSKSVSKTAFLPTILPAWSTPALRPKNAIRTEWLCAKLAAIRTTTDGVPRTNGPDADGHAAVCWPADAVWHQPVHAVPSDADAAGRPDDDARPTARSESVSSRQLPSRDNLLTIFQCPKCVPGSHSHSSTALKWVEYP